MNKCKRKRYREKEEKKKKGDTADYLSTGLKMDYRGGVNDYGYGYNGGGRNMDYSGGGNDYGYDYYYD